MIETWDFRTRLPLAKKLCGACGVAAILLVYSGASSGAVLPTYPFQDPSAPAQSLTATVAAVDTKARTLEVITGVGHALEAVRLEVPPTCRITIADETGQLTVLGRGDIVRIRYRKIGARNVAEDIAVIQPAAKREN